MTIEEAIKIAIKYGAHVRDVHRDDVERAIDTEFPLREMNPWGNE